MSLTENGISTTRKRGKFAYRNITNGTNAVMGQKIIHWNYLDTNGKLHSGVAKSLDAAIAAAAESSGEKID